MQNWALIKKINNVEFHVFLEKKKQIYSFFFELKLEQIFKFLERQFELSAHDNEGLMRALLRKNQRKPQ